MELTAVNKPTIQTTLDGCVGLIRLNSKDANHQIEID